VVPTVAAFGGRIGRHSYAVPALDSWMTPLFRGPPPGLLPLFSASWPRPLRGLFPRVCHRQPSPPVKSPRLTKFNLCLHLGNHAPWPMPPLVCGVEVDHCTPEHTGAALSPPSHCPRRSQRRPSTSMFAVDPNPTAEKLSLAWQPSSRRCGQSFSHPRRIVPVVAAVPSTSQL